jgi:iron complex outermembrane receptor protein
MRTDKWLIGLGVAALLEMAFATSYAQEATPAQGANSVARSDLQEVVVTARRRAENQQTVPVSVTALSASALIEQNVQLLQDLNTVVPGFRFAAEGGRDNSDIILRGLSKIPFGPGIPSVVTYIGDVPLPGVASNVPLYDLASVQVLKGPQGTLFGRNTLGGAVVLTPTLPDNDFGGYLDAQGGNLGRYSLEGAATLPIVQDKLSVRVAGQILRGDGYVKNLSGGPDFSNTDSRSARVTVVFKPTDYINNTSIFDYSHTPQTPAGEWLFKTNPGVFTALFAPTFGPALADYVGSNLDAQVAAAQRASGPRSQFATPLSTKTIASRGYGVSNDTRVTLTDDLQLRNIFGYRYVYSAQGADVTATPLLTLNFPPGVPIPPSPFYIFDASQIFVQKFFTDEVQLIGTGWGHRLNWIVGGFYNHDFPGAANGSTYNAFGQPSPAITALFKDTNTAVYAQGGLDLSDWLVHGLVLNLGYRYSWDKQAGCGGAVNGGTTYGTWDQCAVRPGEVVTAKGGDPSWTIGLDYKYSDDQFFYVTTRRGYRGVNVNVPHFSSIYTTGGASPLCALTGGICPDLRSLQTTQPETLTDVEIGSKTNWQYGGMQGRFDIALYRSWYKNGLQFQNFTGFVPTVAPDFPNQNSVGISDNNQTITGVEIGATVRPTDDLTFSLNGAYTQATITSVYSPSPLLTITRDMINLPSPKWSGTLAARWVLPFKPLDSNLVLNADVFTSSSFGASSPTRFPGYTLADARLGWLNIAKSKVDVALFVKNMFDRVYLISPVVVLPTFPVETGIIGTPRTYGIDVRYSF